MEYCAWLTTVIFATAGSPQKHGVLKDRGAALRSSSRDSASFGRAVARLNAGKGFSHCLNSLSKDFITLSVTVLLEGSCFAEIGKLNVWSQERLAVFPHIHYAGGKGSPPR